MRPKTKNFSFIELRFNLPGELEKGFNVGSEPNRSELRTGNEPKIRTGSHREPQFAIQFELGTLASRYGNGPGQGRRAPLPQAPRIGMR